MYECVERAFTVVFNHSKTYLSHSMNVIGCDQVLKNGTLLYMAQFGVLASMLQPLQ